MTTMTILPMQHTLANGASLIHLSPHTQRFSDGTTAEAQHSDICAALTCQRVTREVARIQGMALVELRMTLSPEQLDYLADLCSQAALVLVPFVLLTALREAGPETRARFPNVVAAIATQETQRSAPTEKVWDVTQWSY